MDEENLKGEEDLNLQEKREQKIQAILGYIRTNLSGYEIGSYGLRNFPASEANIPEGEIGYIELIKDGTRAYVLIDFEYSRDGSVKEAKEIGGIKPDGEIKIKAQEEQNNNREEEKKYYLRNDEDGELEVVPEDEDKPTKEMQEMKEELDNDLGTPLQIIKLGRQATEQYAKLNNSINPDSGNLKLVKYPNGIWITVQERENGHVQVAGREVSKLNAELAEALKLNERSVNNEVASNKIEAVKYDDDSYADALVVKRKMGDSDKADDIVNYNRWGKASHDEIASQTGNEIETELSETVYPPKLVMEGRVVEVTSQEIVNSKEELKKKAEEYRSHGYKIDDDMEEKIENIKTKDEVYEIEKELENAEKGNEEQGIERSLWENNPYGE